MREAARQHRAQHGVEQRLVARFGIGAAAQLRQGQRALGQRLEDEEAALARGATGEPGDEGVHHGAGGVGAVAGKACGAADQQGRCR